jgi:phosphatidylinositol glycan class M
MWLQQGFHLEFLGKSTFVPGLWMASQSFFLTNAWILGIIVSDIGGKVREFPTPQSTSPSPSKEVEQQK